MNFEWTFSYWLKFLVTKLPWVMIVAVFGFLTAKTSSVLFLQFVNGEASSIVTTVFAKNISLPNSTICLPLIYSELYKVPMDEADLSETYYREFVAKNIQQKEFWKENLLQSTWSRTLLQIAHNYLACMTAFEFFEESNISCSENATDDDFFDAWNTFSNQLQINDVTTDELRQKFGREMAVAYSLSVTKQSALYGSALNVDFNLTTYVDLLRICYRMRFDQHPLQRGISDAFVIETTPPLTNGSYDYIKSRGLDYGDINVDLSGRAVCELIEAKLDNFIFVSEISFSMYHVVIPIIINSMFQVLPHMNGKIRCSESQSIDSCKAECRANYIREMCNCTSTVNNYPFTEVWRTFHFKFHSLKWSSSKIDMR
jgi:hypothetical protein